MARECRKSQPVQDITLDATSLLERLESHSKQIQTIHVVADNTLDVAVDGEPIESGFVATLKERIGNELVEEIEVYS